MGIEREQAGAALAGADGDRDWWRKIVQMRNAIRERMRGPGGSSRSGIGVGANDAHRPGPRDLVRRMGRPLRYGFVVASVLLAGQARADLVTNPSFELGVYGPSNSPTAWSNEFFSTGQTSRGITQ